MVRVLVVDDDRHLGDAVQRGLRSEGYAVDIARNGTDALWLADENEYDAIVLDVMLPDTSGTEVCRRLREAENWTPVLMLTARVSDDDIVEALNPGADDYLPKPFAFSVLLARLRALVRRGQPVRPAVAAGGRPAPRPRRHQVTARRRAPSRLPRSSSRCSSS